MQVARWNGRVPRLVRFSIPHAREADRHAAAIVRVGFAVAAAAFAVQAATHLYNELARERAAWHLNADVDGNVFTWASSLATLAAGVAALALARSLPAYRRRLLPLAAILVFFAVDDLLGVHEDLGAVLTLVSLPDVAGIWFPLYFPVFVLTLALLWALGEALPAVARPIQLGLLLLAAAIAGEVLSAGIVPALDRDRGGSLYAVEVAIEEAGELAGWLLIAFGLLAARELLVPVADEAAVPELARARPA